MPKEIQLRLTAPHSAQNASDPRGEALQRGLLRTSLGEDSVGNEPIDPPLAAGKPVAWFAPNYRVLSDV